MLRAGCFVGNIEELKERAKNEGKKDYVRLCKWLKKELKVSEGARR